MEADQSDLLCCHWALGHHTEGLGEAGPHVLWLKAATPPQKARQCATPPHLPDIGLRFTEAKCHSLALFFVRHFLLSLRDGKASIRRIYFPRAINFSSLQRPGSYLTMKVIKMALPENCTCTGRQTSQALGSGTSLQHCQPQLKLLQAGALLFSDLTNGKPALPRCSHRPCDDVSVSDRLCIQQHSGLIIPYLYTFSMFRHTSIYLCVIAAYSIQYSNMLYRLGAWEQ